MTSQQAREKPAIFAADFSRLIKRDERLKRLVVPTKAPTLTNLEARDHILSAVATITGTPPREVLGNSRIYSVVYARKLTAAALRALGFTLACIGLALNRDHTSIMNQIEGIYALACYEETAAHDLVWAIHAADELAS